ncbi:hypothetical protein [Fulvivirga lutea]|uniref:Lipocalin-like domain-containing protein n=1 Tax=Fulvivirga lutea TaxID=2810512 RepID=A0A975A0W7_9BACT|nr:hypothetical protein [Fulvivirga lutea]QSE97241.1 hypothetical protein JR347_16865 [Fulvivirga lutea]
MNIKTFFYTLVISILPLLGYSQGDTNNLLQLNTWGLHSLIEVDSVETDGVLGDSDSRLTFKSDGTLLEFDSGIERNYNWKLISDSVIEIRKTESEVQEKYKSFLRLEQIKTIEKVDSSNLILTTEPINGIRYRYHYMKF